MDKCTRRTNAKSLMFCWLASHEMHMRIFWLVLCCSCITHNVKALWTIPDIYIYSPKYSAHRFCRTENVQAIPTNCSLIKPINQSQLLEKSFDDDDNNDDAAPWYLDRILGVVGLSRRMFVGSGIWGAHGTWRNVCYCIRTRCSK